MNYNEIPRAKVTPEVVRKPYTRPAVTTFGAVGALTQSGSMMDGEMTMQTGGCSMGQMAMC